MVYIFFEKRSAGSGVNMHASTKTAKTKTICINKINVLLDLATHQLAEKLHKPTIKKFQKRTVYSRFKDNIWGADLADMQSIKKFNERFRFLLCVPVFSVNMFGLFVWNVKKELQLLMLFRKF